MTSTNSNSHLTLEERHIIEPGIPNDYTKTANAITIGKDNSTVGKEIKLHRTCTLINVSSPLNVLHIKTAFMAETVSLTVPNMSPSIAAGKIVPPAPAMVVATGTTADSTSMSIPPKLLNRSTGKLLLIPGRA